MGKRNPYKGYKVYGPYPDRSQPGRLIMTLVSPTRRTTTPYPRYLMALKLGRLLTALEHVDHINDDRSDNRIENLQILTPAENHRKGKEKPPIQVICPNCNLTFLRKRRNLREARGAVIRVPTCCSRSCSRRMQSKLGLDRHGSRARSSVVS